MDVKKIITEAVEKIMKDKKLQELFMKDPVKALEQILNVDLPDDMINPVIDGIKAKIAIDKVDDAVGLLKKLF